MKKLLALFFSLLFLVSCTTNNNTRTSSSEALNESWTLEEIKAAIENGEIDNYYFIKRDNEYFELPAFTNQELHSSSFFTSVENTYTETDFDVSSDTLVLFYKQEFSMQRTPVMHKVIEKFLATRYSIGYFRSEYTPEDKLDNIIIGNCVGDSELPHSAHIIEINGTETVKFLETSDKIHLITDDYLLTGSYGDSYEFKIKEGSSIETYTVTVDTELYEVENDYDEKENKQIPVSYEVEFEDTEYGYEIVNTSNLTKGQYFLANGAQLFYMLSVV